jgi:hypothetical protein
LEKENLSEQKKFWREKNQLSNHFPKKNPLILIHPNNQKNHPQLKITCKEHF